MSTLRERLKDLLVHRILGLDDTPHRIAWGVLIGTFVAFTPTLGFQIALYVAVATLLRANKISGIPILFISNPFTAVPLYYSVWKVGSLVLPGTTVSGSAVRGRLLRVTEADLEWADALTLQFWSDVGTAIVDLGVELWLGALVLGLVFGVPLFFVSYWAVMEYRRRTWHK